MEPVRLCTRSSTQFVQNPSAKPNYCSQQSPSCDLHSLQAVELLGTDPKHSRPEGCLQGKDVLGCAESPLSATYAWQWHCNATDTTEVLLWLRDLKSDGPSDHVTALLPTPRYQRVEWLDKEKEIKCQMFLPCGDHLPTMG